MHRLLNFFSFALLLTPALLCAQIFSAITESPVMHDGGSSAAVTFVDIDNDGDLDLFITNDEAAQPQLLYRNDGAGNFIRVTGDPINAAGGHAVGASWGDVDNDGDSDCLIAHWGNNNEKFYVNRGDGSFIDSVLAPLTTSHGSSETASWADYDADGWLDVVVSNSAGANHRTFQFHSNGDGTFTRAQTGAIATDGGSTRSVDWCDFDNDGDLDLFVTHENSEHDALFINQGDDGFVRMAAGQPPVNDGASGLTSSWGDMDNDGDFDLVVGTIGGTGTSLLYRNLGGTFERVTGSAVESNYWVFGSAWADIDNDGDLDLLVTNGWGENNSEFKHNSLYLNNGTGSFTLAATEPVCIDSGWGFGCSFGDIDRDQDLDLCIARFRSANEDNLLYRNNQSANRGLTMRTIGVQSNRSGIGTRVRCVATIFGQRVSQIREVSGQNGYCGQNLELHFGCGDAQTVDSLLLDWPSGIQDVYLQVPTNQHLVLTEGQGNVRAEDPRPLPAEIALFTIAPNPFNASAEIRFDLPVTTRLSLNLYDSAGRLSRKIGEQLFLAGEHRLKLAGNDLATGTYFLRAASPTYSATQKLILLR